MNYNIKCLFISNNNYGTGIPSLIGANTITRKISDFFVNELYIPSTNVCLLQDAPSSEAIHNIYAFLNQFSNNQNDADILFFYFCGHGFATSQYFNELILSTADTEDITKSVVGLRLQSILEKIQELQIKKYIIILDCCNSGLASCMGEETQNAPKIIEKSGSVIISSSKGTDAAYEMLIEGTKQPCFSHYFLKSLRELNQAETSEISMYEIFEKTCQFMGLNTSLNMKPQVKSVNTLLHEKIFSHKQMLEEKAPSINILDIIDWRITSDCNNKCGVCYASEKFPNLKKEQIDIIIEKLADSPCKIICITGGEPTLSPNFSYLIEQLYENEFSIFLSTNGSNFDILLQIDRYLEKLSLPLDGFNCQSNMLNGRCLESFDEVIKILDYYKIHKPTFPIKISTVLSNNYTVDHLNRMINLLNKYPITIWKIYEFIPEGRGKQNRSQYTPSPALVRSVENFVIEKNRTVKFHIEFIKRKKRDSAYFIIQPNGSVMIPIDSKKPSNLVCEHVIGNLLTDSFDDILKQWAQQVNEKNYFSNIKYRNLKKSFALTPLEEQILFYITSQQTVPSIESLSTLLSVDSSCIENTINKLYDRQIVKNIIPIINLKMFNIKIFLVTLSFTPHPAFPNGYIADYLCREPHIGWITEWENGQFRVALFANNSDDATKIIQKMKDDLQGSLSYIIHDLIQDYPLGESQIFSPLSTNIMIQKSTKAIEDTVRHNYQLSQTEFNILKNLENLRRPTLENIDENIMENQHASAKDILLKLQNDGVIKHLYSVLDTRLLGYEWYVIFVSNLTQKDAVEQFIPFLQNISSVTHINHFMPLTSDYTLDFEVHVSTYVEVEHLYETLSDKFNEIELHPPLKIIKEYKFSFLTPSVTEKIYRNHVKKESVE